MRFVAPCLLLGLVGCADLIGLRGYDDRPAETATAGGGGGGGGGGGAMGGDGGIGGSAPPCNAYCQLVMSHGPVSYWRLNETDGTVARDAMGNRHASYELEGGGSIVQGLPGLIEDDDLAVQLTQPPAMPMSAILEAEALDFSSALPFTLEVWFRPNQLSDSRIMGQLTQNLVYGYWLGVQSGDFVFNRVSPNLDTTSTPLTALFTRYHIVGAFTGTNLRLYLDGQLKSAVTSGDLLLPADDMFRIGHGCEDAVLDEIAVYPVALTDKQVADHYNAGVALEP